MRRYLISLSALSFLSAVVGCQTTAGVCDCADCCGGDYHGPAPVLKPEPLNLMPKENGNDKPAAPDKDK